MNVANLPLSDASQNSEEVRAFFDKYFQKEIVFPSSQIDAVVGFFQKRGFDDLAARSTAIVLLNQARLDNVNIFELIDSLGGLADVQLSNIVTEVMNVYREKTSYLGYKLIAVEETLESRNIRQ